MLQPGQWRLSSTFLVILAVIAKVLTVSQVSARRLSCARARGFVRAWHRAADHGESGRYG